MVSYGYMTGNVVRRADWHPSQFSMIVLVNTAPFIAGGMNTTQLFDC